MATETKNISKNLVKEEKITKAYQAIIDSCKAPKTNNPKALYKLPKTCEKYAPLVDYIDHMDMQGFHITLKDGTKVIGWAREISKQLAPKLTKYEKENKKEAKA